MNPTIPNLDAIVAEVVRRLSASAALPGCGCRGKSPQLSAGNAPSLAPAVDAAVLPWEDRLLTAAALHDRLHNVRAISLRPRTVVTPEARDLLKRHGIALLTGNAAATEGSTAAAAPPTAGKSGCGEKAESCHCGCRAGSSSADARNHQQNAQKSVAPTRPALVGGGTIDPQMAGTIERALVQRGIALELVSASGLLSILDQLIERVAHHEARGLLVSRESAIALCLANRHPQVRAVQVDSLAQLERAMTTLAPNLLILSPEGNSSFQLVRLAEEFARREAQAASPWAARL